MRLMAWVSGLPRSYSHLTLAPDFKSQFYKSGQHTCEAKVWDTSGQAHLRDTVRTQYRTADCIMFVFDVTRPETLEALVPYIQEAESEVTGRPRETILVANKIDDPSMRQVTAEEGSAFAESHKLNDYREVQ